MKISHITNEDASGLNVGDPVIITGKVQFQGKTGDIVDFGKDNRFVIVNLYNFGKHSFHSSDVSYNDYADSGQEEADAYDRDSDARDWMHNQEVGESKAGTKFVGKWKGTDSAAKAKHRLVGEAKSLQSKFEKHLARHGYDVNEKSKYWDQKLKDIDAQIAAWDADMAARKQGKKMKTTEITNDIANAVKEGMMDIFRKDKAAKKKEKAPNDIADVLAKHSADHPEEREQRLKKEKPGMSAPLLNVGESAEDANFTKWMRQNYPGAAKSAETYAKAKKAYAQHLRTKYKDHPAYKQGVNESNGTEHRGFTIRTERDGETGKPVYWIYYRGRDTDRGATTLASAKETIDRLGVEAGLFKEQGVAEDDAGDVEQRMIAKIEKEKQRLAKLKQTDPEAYKREMEKRKTSSRIPPVSTFEGQGVAEGEYQDEGFFVAIGSEENGGFVGMVYKEGGKWREQEVAGNAPHNWGASYMGYLSTGDVMQYIRQDYGRHSHVKGPFDTEEAAFDFASRMYGLEEGVAEAVIPGGEADRKGGGWPAIVDNNAKSLYPAIKKFMQEQSKRYQKYATDEIHATGTTGIPSFKGAKDAKISYADNIRTIGGRSRIATTYQCYVGVGELLGKELLDKMIAEFANWYKEETGAKNLIVTADGYTVRYGIPNGYNGYGVEFNKLSDQEIKMYQDSIEPYVQGVAEGSEPAKHYVQQLSHMMGAASNRWHTAKKNGKPVLFNSKEEALDAVKRWSDQFKKASFRYGGEVQPKKGVAEGEYDPSYDPEYRGFQKPEQDPDAWKQERDLEEPSAPKTVTIRDQEGNVVLQFPSTGGYYGDVRQALSKGFDTESGDYDIKWQKGANEDAMMSEASGASSEQVASAIVRRIIFKYKDAISAYGPEAIMAAAREVGEYFAGSEELGTSDISIATKYALDKLEQQAIGNLQETASGGCTGAGSIATTPAGGAGKNVGSLFGGTYKQKRTKKSPGTK